MQCTHLIFNSFFQEIVYFKKLNKTSFSIVIGYLYPAHRVYLI